MDLPAWFRQGHEYVADNLALVAWMFGLELLLSYMGAVVLARRLAWSDPVGPKLQRVPMWYWAFRDNRPRDTRTFAQVTLRDGAQYWGYVGHYTSDDLPIDERELELRKPVSLRLSGDIEPRKLPESVDRVLLAGEIIQAVVVMYQQVPGALSVPLQSDGHLTEDQLLTKQRSVDVEVMAKELGPSLRWATATITRTMRSQER